MYSINVIKSNCIMKTEEGEREKSIHYVIVVIMTRLMFNLQVLRRAT